MSKTWVSASDVTVRLEVYSRNSIQHSEADETDGKCWKKFKKYRQRKEKISDNTETWPETMPYPYVLIWLCVALGT